MVIQKPLPVGEVDADHQRAGFVLAHDDPVIDIPGRPPGMPLAGAPGQRGRYGVDLVESHATHCARAGPAGEVSGAAYAKMTLMGTNDAVLDWLLTGDVAVQFQARRDLLGEHRPDLQARIGQEGDGATLLAARGADGRWGCGFYQPKWTSSHYTLLELRNLGLPQDDHRCRETVALIGLETGADGGVNPAGTVTNADVCVNGMFLSYAAYFGADAGLLGSVVDFLLAEELPSGGFNCRSNRAHHARVRVASVHTTLSVIEG